MMPSFLCIVRKVDSVRSEIMHIKFELDTKETHGPTENEKSEKTPPPSPKYYMLSYYKCLIRRHVMFGILWSSSRAL